MSTAITFFFWFFLNLFIIVSVYHVLGFYRYRQRALIAEQQVQFWKELVEQRANVANEFMQACRLISIDRNLRFNYFTFARGNETFTIETMGLLSDNLDEWYTKAGLKPLSTNGA